MLNPVLAMAIGIVVMMVLIIFTKMHAFPSLIISAILIAVLAMPFGPEGATVATLTECVSTVTKGFGNTMASIGVVIGFGCIMGIFLEKSGADRQPGLGGNRPRADGGRNTGSRKTGRDYPDPGAGRNLQGNPGRN